MFLIYNSQIEEMDHIKTSDFAVKLKEYFERNTFVKFDFSNEESEKTFKKIISDCRHVNIVSEKNILEFIILKYHEKIFQNEKLKDEAERILSSEYLTGDQKIFFLKKMIT